MRAIGIILAGGHNRRMKELSEKRAISAMPVAGSYRSIDFALSNMSNSHTVSYTHLDVYKRQVSGKDALFLYVSVNGQKKRQIVSSPEFLPHGICPFNN